MLRRIKLSQHFCRGNPLLAALLHKSGGVELPDAPYFFSKSPRFEAERSGAFDKRWLLQLPVYKPLVRNGVYLPRKEDLWLAPMHEGLEKITERLPYHDALRYIMEHNFFFLFTTLLKARDAPLPHMMYEDFMKCRTFSSLQNPPEEQFALQPELLRALLCKAAHHCILDPHYFTTCQLLFRRMEQQQTMTSETLSAWVYCCSASGNIEVAITYARHMADHDIPFDEFVFSLMQHPSVDPVAAEHRAIPHSVKGVLLQRRLSRRLQMVYRADTVAVHGMFVFCALSLSHIEKWEVLRAATSHGVVLSERTLTLAVEVYAQEKGVRCGPQTVKALVLCLVHDGPVGHLIYVLLRTRKNEQLREFRGLPHTVFSEEEQEAIMQYAEQRARQNDGGFAVALPLLRALVKNEDPRGLLHALVQEAHVERICNRDGSKRSPDDGICGAARECVADGELEIGAMVASVNDLLSDVDALDKASRSASASGEKLDNAVFRPTQVDLGQLSEELQELQKKDFPTGVRELARLHILGGMEEISRTARLHAAWVNPDGTL